MRNKWFKIFTIIIGLVALGFLTSIAIPLIKSYNNPTEFTKAVNSYGAWGLPMMLFVQLAQIVVALIPGEVVEFVAGTLYGWFWGTIFCLVGVAIGQTVIFQLVRTFGKSFIDKVAGSDAVNRFKFLRDEQKLKRVIFLLFFIPGTPKDLITYAVPLTKIDLKTFLAISLIARIPSIISSTFAGSAFSDRKFFALIIAYSAILVFSGLGILVYRIWTKKHDKKHNN